MGSNCLPNVELADIFVFVVMVVVPSFTLGFSSKSLAVNFFCDETGFGRPGDLLRGGCILGEIAFFLDGDFDLDRLRLPGDVLRFRLGEDERALNRVGF